MTTNAVVTQPSMEQRMTLFKAAETGDIACLEAFFEQPNVRAAVAATELFISRHLPLVDTRFTTQPAQDVVYPWYYMPSPSPQHRNKSVFMVAVCADQVEAIEWFFSPERIAFMRATLAFMWSQLTGITMHAKLYQVLEVLLVASAAIYPDANQCQAKLNDLVGGDGFLHADMMKIAIAHGAEVHTSTPLERCAGYGTEELVEAFAEEGAFVVGADVLKRASYTGKRDVARRLMQLGVDFGSSSEGLQIAAKEVDIDMVRLFVKEGFVDIDAHDAQGRTALMWLVSCEPMAADEDVAEVARTLINAGADTTIEDHESLTALDHANLREYTTVAEALAAVQRESQGCPRVTVSM